MTYHCLHHFFDGAWISKGQILFFFLNGKILLTNKPVRGALKSSGGKKNKYKGKSVAAKTPARTKTPIKTTHKNKNTTPGPETQGS
jgi:hypothetical protein